MVKKPLGFAASFLLTWGNRLKETASANKQLFLNFCSCLPHGQGEGKAGNTRAVVFANYPILVLAMQRECYQPKHGFGEQPVMQTDNGCAEKPGVLTPALTFALHAARAELTAWHLWAKVGREQKCHLHASLSVSVPQTYL